MSNKKLTILGIVAVLMVLWAVMQSRFSNRSGTEPVGLAYLIQGFDPSGVNSIVIGAGEDAFTLKNQRGGFVVADKDNYPAKTSEINSLITKCLEIQTSEFVTDNPANFEDLEVTEEKARSVVKFMKADPNSSLLTGVVIGKTKELGQGSYVRMLSSDAAVSNRVYVTSNAPWFGGGVMNYIDQELISAKSEDIESVTASSKDGQYTLRKKPDSQDIILDNIPAGKKLKSSEAQSVLTALTSLRFDDVKKIPSDLAFDKQYMCRLKDSTVYALRIAQRDGKTYVSCVAEFTDKTPVEKASIDQGGEVESEEELKKKEAKLLARDNATKFTTKHQGWVYEIADWKAKNLTKELADLLEDEEKPEENAAADPNAVIPDIISVPEIEDPNS
ncbi:MAG: DUF4340 domain-containing protein [Sedimentisphaerales bacterium]|nr:DUF4340 domain-containing protein [Sedimentisphaerales bacterium]